MANLRLRFSDLVLRVTDFLAWTNGSAPTGDNLTNGTAIVARGYRQFLYPIDQRTGQAHEWNFLKKFYSMNLTNGNWRYLLPDDFSSIITNPNYGDDENYKEMRRVTSEQIKSLRAGGVTNYAPYLFAIVNANYDKETGDKDEIWFYPESDSSYSISFWYKSDPLKLDSDDDYLVGGVKAVEAIIENCLAVAEQQENDEIGIHTELAVKLTQELIITDSNNNRNIHIGNLYSDNEYQVERRNTDNNIDYSALI